MFLKSLKLAGFKSFADRTRLEFEPGVTVVVGPNGSGKSNIVDALAWVMGTQSAKSLRTQRMEDVIFAGTATRPQLNRSEVTLVFDNERGMIPLDMPEVSITRRLYRDGSSDYEINGTPCRLLDIQELLSDTHVGRHQHVIVGQGQLDAILNAKPEDHRAIIEEAAGILKHRLRKDRAVRRLERTDADVLRLQDILGELTRQMRPLKRQARDAERHGALAAEALALRLYVSGEELRAIDARMVEVSREQVATSEVVARSEAELGDVETAHQDLRVRAGEAGAALERDTAAAARLETTSERLRSIAQLSAERSRALRSRLEGAAERQVDLHEEAQALINDLAQAGAEEAAARDASERAEAKLRVLTDEERSLSEQESMPTEGAVAMTRGELRAQETAQFRDERDLADIADRNVTVTAQLEAVEGEIGELNEQIQEMDAALEPARTAFDRARRELEAAQESADTAAVAERDASIELASARAELRAIELALAGRGDREAVELAARSEVVTGTISQHLDVPADLVAAVTAALGSWTDALAVASADQIESLAGSLKGEGLGGVALVAARFVEQIPARSVAESSGLDALVDLLPGETSRLAAALLGDVVVAEGWQAGWKLVQRNPSIRVVTPEGDLITVDGIGLGNPDGASFMMVEAAHARVESAEIAASRAASFKITTTRSLSDAEIGARTAETALSDLEARLAGATEAMDLLGRRRTLLTQEQESLRSRTAVITEAATDRRSQIETLRRRLEALEGEEAERQRAWDELARRRQHVAEQRDAARVSRQDAASRLGAVVERRQLLDRRLAEVRSELDRFDSEEIDPDEISRLDQLGTAARHTLDVVAGKLAVLRARQMELRNRAGEVGAALTEARQTEERLRKVISDSKERSARLAVEATELRVRREAVAEALRRDVDADETQALSAERPELDDEIDPRERLETVRATLRRMGPVNPLAAEEFADLEGRHQFLDEQLKDLEQSRSELRKVITVLDEEIAGLFARAFDEVARHYQDNFAILFPGGRGTLTLTDPKDSLGSGVDIHAQPLGKKVSRLTLLSGGERSLAALAFLFAVFKARPSPFYVLDEVEAALDDANLRRFLKLVEDFRAHAQMVVITHQQQTMEAADTLYGVTMEPGGSSQVIAKRLSTQLVQT